MVVEGAPQRGWVNMSLLPVGGGAGGELLLLYNDSLPRSAGLRGYRFDRAALRSTFCGLAAPLWGQAPPARPARWRLPGGAVASEWAPPTVRCARADSVRAVAGRVAALLCPDEEIETLVAPNGDLVFARALHARRAPALGDVLGGASVVEVQATSGDLELPAVRLVVAGD